MARDILSEFGPERGRRRPGNLENMDIKTGAKGIGDQRDVMNYRAPSRVATPYDPRSVGLHGDNKGCCGSQGPESVRCESSGGPGIGGDENRMAGSQGKR